MKTKQEIIVLIGVMGSGKTFTSQKYIKKGDYITIAFADSIKEIASKLLNTNAKLEEFKTKKISIDEEQTTTGRNFLQQIGTNIRYYDPRFWINICIEKTKKNLENKHNVIITDARFFNEIDIFEQFRSEEIDVKYHFCNYKSSLYNDYDEHESEKFAQAFVKENFQDGHILSYEEIIFVCQKYSLI